MGDVASPSSIVEAACSRAGLSQAGPAGFEPFLEAWCADLAQAVLSADGREALRRVAIKNMATRFEVYEILRQHPEIAAVRLPSIVRIVGFPRSGTTLLHNLMALRRDARSLARWELVEPTPPPEAATVASDPRIEKVQRAVDRLRGSEIERLHFVQARDPEECTWGFLDASGLLGRAVIGLMDRWTDLIFDRSLDMRATYESYRLLVQLLLWRNPPPQDGVLVLKCPTDVGHLATFLDVFPEASLVLCHRDPFRTVTSSCRIQEVAQRPFLAEPDARIGTDGHGPCRTLRIQAGFADAMVEVAATHPERVTTVRYDHLMTRPGETVCRALRELDVTVHETSLRRSVAAFIESQSHRRARPPDSYPDYGYTSTQVHRHPSMDRYRQRFGVLQELDRITAPTSS